MQLQGTNTYLVGTGHRRLLIDTGQGIPSWSQLVAEMCAEQNIVIDKVLLTHWHGDHTGGIPDLIHLYPELERCIFKNFPDAGQQPIADSQIFRVEGATVRAVFTPGHSEDHMCFLLEEENALFTGDNILGHGTTAVEDLTVYMKSLYRMKDKACKVGYPGHGETICELQLLLQAEIGRKQRRERQIIAGLKSLQGRNGKDSAGATPRELVFELFGSLPADVVDTIFEPFMKELLMKLATEKRVAFRFQAGQRSWFVQEH
jgi:hydrolase